MLDFVWAGLMLISIISGFVNGRTGEVSAAIFSGAGNAVTLCISLLGCICLFSGIMEIAQKSGLSKIIAAAQSPMIRLIFPRLDMNSRAAQAISLNITANLLGLGNAATPMGIQAAKRLRRGRTATNELCRLIVLNTASIQLIPANVAAVRSALGCASAFDILPAVWITSLFSAGLGVCAAWLLGKVWGE